MALKEEVQELAAYIGDNLAANLDVLQVLVQDPVVQHKIKNLLNRKANLPVKGQSVYETGTHGDIFEREVLEVHSDFTITVTDTGGADRGRPERLTDWRLEP